jgi:hypothetical protein
MSIPIPTDPEEAVMAETPAANRATSPVADPAAAASTATLPRPGPQGPPPTETPPAESSATGAIAYPEPPEMGRARGLVPVVLITLFGLFMAAMFLAMAIEEIRLT